MSSLIPETWAYGGLALVSLGLLAVLARNAWAMRPRPAAALVLLALTASLAVSAVAIFVAALLRLAHAGPLSPLEGTILRACIASGVVGALSVVYWWRFRRR